MRIIITGTPGVGKTKTAELLSRITGLNLFKITDIATNKKLVSKNHEVDMNRLTKALRFLKNEKGYIVEGHLACEMNLPADRIIILRCHPNELRKRLKKRGYSRDKTEENILSEVLDYCTQRVEQEYDLKKTRCLEIDTTKRNIKETAEVINQALKTKKARIDRVKYSIKDYLRLPESKRKTR